MYVYLLYYIILFVCNCRFMKMELLVLMVHLFISLLLHFHFLMLNLLLHSGLILTREELEIFTIVKRLILISLLELPVK